MYRCENKPWLLLRIVVILLLVGVGTLWWGYYSLPPDPPVLSVSVSEEKKIPEAEKNEEKKEIKKVVKKKRVVKRDAEGWLPYLTIGRNSYAKFRTHDKDRKILASRGYTEEEITEYFDFREKGNGSYGAFFKGEKFLWVVFGNARVVEKLRAVWKVPQPGTLYQLKSGRNIVVLDECENLAEVAPRPVEKKEEVILPPVVEVPSVEAPPVAKEEKPQPSVVEVPLPVQPVSISEVPENEKVNCFNSLKKWDPNLFVGHEREPRHNGNSMEATDLSAALYCLWQTEDPNVRHGLGINFKGSWFEGRVNHGSGKFTGYLLAGGPAYKRIQKDKWDMELRLLVGALHEDFRQGGYKNDRDFGVIGPSFILNDYSRRAQGYKWSHETQLYWELLFPFTSNLNHSWEGKPLHGNPDGLDARFNVSVRHWLYDNKIAQPYVQASYFLEAPGAESLSLRFGIANPNRFVGVGGGIDFDLKNGGEVFGWGPWIDVTTGLRMSRVASRSSQMTDVTGIGGGVTTSPDGFIMVPVGEDVSNSSNLSGQPNGVNSNAVDSPNLDGSSTDR